MCRSTQCPPCQLQFWSHHSFINAPFSLFNFIYLFWTGQGRVSQRRELIRIFLFMTMKTFTDCRGRHHPPKFIPSFICLLLRVKALLASRAIKASKDFQDHRGLGDQQVLQEKASLELWDSVDSLETLDFLDFLAYGDWKGKTVQIDVKWTTDKSWRDSLLFLQRLIFYQI